jgi:hypothetical protein
VGIETGETNMKILTNDTTRTYRLADGFVDVAAYCDGEVLARYNAEADFLVLVDCDTEMNITAHNGWKGAGSVDGAKIITDRAMAA